MITTVSTLNAWQLLLWIVGLEVLSLPLIAGCANSIIKGYFRAKEEHVSKVARAVGEAFTKMGEQVDKIGKIGKDILENGTKKAEGDQNEH